MAQAADNRKSKSHILIVCEGDRFIRVYSDGQHVDVKSVTVPFMISQQGEILVDELLQQRLRGIWHSTYTEGHLVAMHPIRDLKPEDIVTRDLDMAVLRTIEKHEVHR
jgi:hypothetical protein